MRNISKKIVFSAFVLILTAFQAYSWDFVPAFDANIGGVYSYLPDEENESINNSFGGEAGFAGSFMMNSDILPQLWLIPTITANFSTTAQPLNVEDERFLFSKWADMYFSYGINYEFNSRWEWRLRGFARLDYSAQTKNEEFGTGLYDYSDTGMYIENSNSFDYYGSSMEFILGYKYLDRRFPNYTTLLSSATQSEIDEIFGGAGTPNSYTKEKDSFTHSLYISDEIQWGNSGWLTILRFTYDYIPYVEQKVIDEDGTLKTEPRVDRYSTIELEIPYYSSDNSSLEIDYSLIVRSTNQNYNDTKGTTEFDDDLYISNYYNYIENILKFAVNYEFPLKLFTDYKPLAIIALSLDMIQYNTRFAKDPLGDYRAELQQDTNYTLSLNVSQGIMEFWSYYLGAAYTKYSSNMQWEAYGVYNYSYFTLNFGTALSF